MLPVKKLFQKQSTQLTRRQVRRKSVNIFRFIVVKGFILKQTGKFIYKGMLYLCISKLKRIVGEKTVVGPETKRKIRV